MNPRVRYVAMTAGLLGGTVPLAIAVRHSYGPAAARRFAVGAGISVLAQQFLVGIAIRRSGARQAGRPPHALSLVDAITLSRGGTAALLVGLLTSGMRDRRGWAGWLGWVALLYGAIVSDWLDGPIARRLGTSQIGAMLDIEADSWLTLSSSGLAMASGGLPAYAMAAPLLRYVRLAALRRLVPYRELVSGDPLWTRHVGMAQMMVFIAALAPFRGPLTNFLLRAGAPLVATAQLVTLAVVSWSRLKPRVRMPA
jgi:phosphatidylglycerophosphate synthase